VCLYVRDAFGLEPVGADVPPSLDGVIQVNELNTDLSDRRDLSLAWLTWWRRLIDVTVATQSGDGRGAMQRDELRRAHVSARQSVFDPFEDFESLKDFPSLRSAAQQTWRQGVDWTDAHVAKVLRPGSSIPKNVAELVIQEHHVSPERVRAAVLVLAVEGRWSHITNPGILLCSQEAFFDDALFATELKKTFESGLHAADEKP
jgi:hypothetical protein